MPDGQELVRRDLDTWEAMMDSYRKALANTKAPKAVLFGACATSRNAAMYRYGMASTMLEDNGYFSFSEDALYTRLPWYDESEAPLGTAAEVATHSAHFFGHLGAQVHQRHRSGQPEQNHGHNLQRHRLLPHQGQVRHRRQQRAGRRLRDLATPNRPHAAQAEAIGVQRIRVTQRSGRVTLGARHSITAARLRCSNPCDTHAKGESWCA